MREHPVFLEGEKRRPEIRLRFQAVASLPPEIPDALARYIFPFHSLFIFLFILLLSIREFAFGEAGRFLKVTIDVNE